MPDSPYGPYWAVSKYKDIMHCEVHHEVFSNEEQGGIQIEDQPKDMERPSFIRMDPPRHDEQRKVASPIVAPDNLANMETADPRTHPNGAGRAAAQRDIRLGRAGLDQADHNDAGHPVRFPFEERAKLTYWSDVAICNVNDPEAPVHSELERFEEIKEMAEYMGRLFMERREQPPKFDLLSMLAHGEATRDMPLQEFMGNLVLLIVGGNDTTRNSMSGGLLALNQFPDEYRQAAGQSGDG